MQKSTTRLASIRFAFVVCCLAICDLTFAQDTNKGAASPADAPTAKEAELRRNFVGKWRVVNAKGGTIFFITLDDAGNSVTTNGDGGTGKWEVVGNEVRITWGGDWRDIIRAEKDGYRKYAFKPGTTWEDNPIELLWVVKDADRANRTTQDEMLKAKILHTDDETSLIRIKANPETAIGKLVVICGYITLSDYYNFSYDKAQDSHYSISFTELGETSADRGKTAHAYFKKAEGREIIERFVLAAEKANVKTTVVVVRLAVTLIPSIYKEDKQWDMFEIIDIQEFDYTSNNWSHWIVKTGKERAKEQEQIAKAAAEAEEDAKREAKKKAAAAKLAAVPKKTDEQIAESKLQLAKALVGKNDAAARKKFEEIVDKYPDTDAAKSAKKLLEKK